MQPLKLLMLLFPIPRRRRPMSSQANKLVDTATYYIGYLEKA
jgi:hypothetical protein